MKNIRPLVVILVLISVLNSKVLGQDYVEIRLRLEQADHIVLYTVPSGESRFLEQNASYKRVKSNEWQTIKWRVKEPITTFRLDLSNRQLNRIEIKYIRYSIQDKERYLQGVSIFEEFFPSSFLKVLQSNNDTVTFQVVPLDGFFDPVLYRLNPIQGLASEEQHNVSLNLVSDTLTVVKLIAIDSIGHSFAAAKLANSGENFLTFTFSGLANVDSLVVFPSISNSNTVQLKSLTVHMDDKEITYGPFDIVRNLEIRDFDDFDLDSKGIVLTNIVDRKWEASAITFSVPNQSSERNWWMLGLILLSICLLWIFDQKFFLSKSGIS